MPQRQRQTPGVRGLQPGMALAGSRAAVRRRGKVLVFSVAVPLGNRTLRDGPTMKQLLRDLATAVNWVVGSRRERSGARMNVDLVDRGEVDWL